jgi:peptide/nickel transport system substrate-binding protein
MKNSFFKIKGLVLLGLIFFVEACSNKTNDPGNSQGINYKNKVVIQAIAEPQSLNPVNYNDALADEINHYIFQRLLDVDHKTQTLVPVLAVQRPVITQTPEGFLQVAYTLNPKACWDNGDPITARDVEFSLKVVLCPGVHNEVNKSNFSLIKDFKYSDEDPLSFTIIYREKYIRAEFNSGAEYFILPAYFYDSAKVFNNYRLIDFIDSSRLNKIKTDPKIKKWTDEFNSSRFSRDVNYIKGSGPYKLDNWTTNQEIRLTRKNHWWGYEAASSVSYFEANVDQIIYKIITDQNTALSALKAGQIDVMYGIKPKDFKELNDNVKFKDKFYLNSQSMLGYSYIGVNAANPILSSVTTRKALAHLINIEQIIKTVNYGYGTPVTGPIHPSKQCCYDKSLKPYVFDIELAKKLLLEDGWKDLDNNGILDKIINNKKVDFKISLLINAGNDDRSAIALLLKEWMAKAGIQLEIIKLEWGVFIERITSRNFDLYYGSWFGEFAPEDHTQLFHTSQINGGANYVSFGNKETDSLIDSIRVEINEQKRSEMYKRFHRILYHQANYLFLISPANNIAVNKKFSNVYFTTVYPGFWAPAFKLSQNS